MHQPSDKDALARLRKKIVDSFMSGDGTTYAAAVEEARRLLPVKIDNRIGNKHYLKHKRTFCPRCGQLGTRRWHFDNCRQAL